MAVIAFANSKGGSGKSTSALILACELSEAASVTVIDADPRRPLMSWSRLAAPPNAARFQVIDSGGERSIQDEIDRAAAAAQFVLVDLEGTASRLAGFAMAEADMVIIPTQEQHQDAQAALDTLAEVRREGRAIRREIPAALLLTRTKAAVKSRTARHVGNELRSIDGLRVFRTEIVERDAYAALFSAGGGLRQLNAKTVNGIDRAIENAISFAHETIEILKETADDRTVQA